MRDLKATRQRLLDAAEELFADHGFDGASVQAIARRAGVSRGMPGYAFGSKAELYEAVLTRLFAAPRAIMTDLLAASSADDPARLLTEGVEAYLDFLFDHPRYVRLLTRAATDGTDRTGRSTAHLDALQEGLRGAAAMASLPDDTDVDHLLVSVLALCFFPFAHRDTLIAPMGLDVDDPEFLSRRKAHVVALLQHGLAGPATPEPA